MPEEGIHDRNEKKRGKRTPLPDPRMHIKTVKNLSVELNLAASLVIKISNQVQHMREEATVAKRCEYKLVRDTGERSKTKQTIQSPHVPV